MFAKLFKKAAISLTWRVLFFGHEILSERVQEGEKDVKPKLSSEPLILTANLQNKHHYAHFKD